MSPYIKNNTNLCPENAHGSPESVIARVAAVLELRRAHVLNENVQNALQLPAYGQPGHYEHLPQRGEANPGEHPLAVQRQGQEH